MIITTIKCLPIRRGGLRAWAITQTIVGRPPRTIKIIARRGTDALAISRRAFGLMENRRVVDLVPSCAA